MRWPRRYNKKASGKAVPDEFHFNEKLRLTTEEITTIDKMGMRGEFNQEIWNDFHGSDALNNLIYMAYKLNKLMNSGRFPPVSEVRRKAFNEAADICEKMFIDSDWNSHYRNAAIKCSSAIRALIDKEKETP